MRALTMIALTVLTLLGTGCTLLERALNADSAASVPGVEPVVTGSTERFEFSPDPDPPAPGSGVLTYINGGNVTFFALGGSARDQKAESITFQFEGGRAGGWVAYVDRTEAIDCQSGAIVPLGGGAVLKVHFDGASQHDATDPEYLPTEIPGDGPIVEAKLICDSGGVVEWVIGTWEERNFTVSTYPGDHQVSVNVLR